jgi:predicted nucleotide-binding protein (sugar kinase/HSP70/actin superfamily)
VYIQDMKARLDLSIDEAVLKRVKTYTERHKISISELVEGYLERLSKTVEEQNILDLVDKLEPSELNVTGDLKQRFYEDQGREYGA